MSQNFEALGAAFQGSPTKNPLAIAAASSAYVTPTPLGEGNGVFQQVVLSFNGLPVVTGNTTGASFGSIQVATWPTGFVNILGNVAYFNKITFNTAAGATGDIDGGGSGDYGMGTTATADATIASTDVNLLPSTAMLDPFVTGVGRSNVGSGLAAAAMLGGVTTAISLYLNVIIDDADVSDAAAADPVYFTGWDRITFAFIGPAA